MFGRRLLRHLADHVSLRGLRNRLMFSSSGSMQPENAVMKSSGYMTISIRPRCVLASTDQLPNPAEGLYFLERRLFGKSFRWTTRQPLARSIMNESCNRRF